MGEEQVEAEGEVEEDEACRVQEKQSKLPLSRVIIAHYDNMCIKRVK